MTTTLEDEREQLEVAYTAVEERIARLRGQLKKGVQAVHAGAADHAADGIRTTIEGLEAANSPAAGILLKGKVRFAQTDAAGDLSGATYYVAIAALGVIDQPQVMSWEAQNSDAFRDPLSWRDGASVEEKSIFVGGYRRLDLVQRVRTQGEGAGLPEDEALNQILLSRSGSELTEVVGTIQRSQFELMEASPRETLVIQGGPGTGKTIIGLHRVSVLLFRHGEQLKPEDVLVVTPTDTLARYVSNVLPGLGRGSVRVAPMSELERHGAGRPVPESADLRAARDAELVKGSERMMQVIEREVARLPRVPDAGIEYGGKTLTATRIAEIVEQERSRGGPYSEVRRRIHAALAGALDVGSDADRQAITALFDQVAPDSSPRQLIAELLSSNKRLRESGADVLTPAEQAAIKRPRTNVRDVAWTLSDFPLLDAAHHLLNGPVERSQLHKHIVIDEAQDLSPMQLRMLRRRLADDGAFTILGDLAQATKGWANDSWEAHLASGEVHVSADALKALEAGYRVPRVQMEFASQLLPIMDISTPETTSILDVDAPPEIIRYSTDDELVNEAVKQLQQLMTRRSPGESIGVIGLEDLLDQLHVELEAAGLPSAWADTSRDGHATLVTADDAKGLEFDHVVVLRPEQIYRTDPVTGPRTLYVALTRARRTLILSHVDPLPTALAGQAPEEDSDVAGPPEGDPPGGSGGSPTPVKSQEWSGSFRDGTVLVEWAIHGPATVTFLAPTGSSSLLADGFTTGSPAQLMWGLRTPSGDLVSVQTQSADPAEVAAAVLEALETATG